MPRSLRWLALLVGLLAALPVGALVLCALVAPATRWGFWLVGALALGTAGLIAAPFRPRARAPLVRASLALLALYTVARLGCAAHGPHTRLVTLPDAPGASRWIDRLVDEEDLTVTGARVLAWWGRYPGGAAGLAPALTDAYAEMRDAEGALPSPVAATMLGLQRASASDTLVVEPRRAAERAQQPVGVVFLHGFAGNFTVQCWHAAQAAQAIDAVTVCPSVGLRGDWWSAQGARTIESALAYLAQRGVRRVYLAGLSAGAVGAHAQAARFAPRLAGLVLISGGSSHGGTGGLPTLVVRGRGDPTLGPGVSALVAARGRGAGARVTDFSVPGGHFVFLERRLAVRDAIARWLVAREAAAHAPPRDAHPGRTAPPALPPARRDVSSRHPTTGA